MNRELYNTYVHILEEELIPAMGCTEPIAIAYAASIARAALGMLPEHVEIHVSGNIIKNVNGKFTFFVNDKEIKEDDKNNSLTLENGLYTGNLTVINSRGSILPATGSPMTIVLTGAGILCLLITIKRGKTMMKNKFKKLGITALACVVSLTTAGTVANLVNSGNNGNMIFTKLNAEGTGHITINANVGDNGVTQSLAGKKFNIYRIFDAQNSAGMESINYTMNPAYEKR